MLSRTNLYHEGKGCYRSFWKLHITWNIYGLPQCFNITQNMWWPWQVSRRLTQQVCTESLKLFQFDIIARLNSSISDRLNSSHLLQWLLSNCTEHGSDQLTCFNFNSLLLLAHQYRTTEVSPCIFSRDYKAKILARFDCYDQLFL